MKTKAHNPVPPHLEYPKMIDCPKLCGQPIWQNAPDGEGPRLRQCWKCSDEEAMRLAIEARR